MTTPAYFATVDLQLPDGRVVTVVGDSTWENPDTVDFYYTEGNGACDCSMADLIRAQVDPAFPEMACGDVLDLVSIRIEQRES